MAFSSKQITLVTSTITPLLVKGSGSGTTFKNITGSLSDPLPVLVRNLDATVTIWIGGSDVSATNGYELLAGESLALSLYGESEIPNAFAVGTPKLSVLCGRQ